MLIEYVGLDDGKREDEIMQTPANQNQRCQASVTLVEVLLGAVMIGSTVIRLNSGFPQGFAAIPLAPERSTRGASSPPKS